MGNLAIAKSRAEEEAGVADVGFEEADAEAVDVVGAVDSGATLDEAPFNEA